MIDDIKVIYVTRGGLGSVAYIDSETGKGTDKHTDEPVELEYDHEIEKWVQL